jgi:protein SCO1/2
LTVSFDPRDTPARAAEEKKAALAKLGPRARSDGWHFLTGDQASIQMLTDSVGFVYRWDSAMQQFVHVAGVMVLTPEGKLSRYFYGIDFASVDLRLGLIEASHDRIGSPVDAVLLFCCRYDASTGKYDWLVGRLLSLAGLLTVLLVGALLFVLGSGPRRPQEG